MCTRAIGVGSRTDGESSMSAMPARPRGSCLFDLEVMGTEECVCKYTRGQERCAVCGATKCCYHGRGCKQTSALRGAVRGGAVGRAAPKVLPERQTALGEHRDAEPRKDCLRVEGAPCSQSLWQVPCVLDSTASFALGHPEVTGILQLSRDAFGGEMKRGWG